MAEVAIAIVPTIGIQMFSGLPYGTNNIYPRARVIATTSTSVAAKIATNTQTVTVNVNLPANYAYVMDSQFIAFRSAATPSDLSHYNDLATQRISPDGATTLVLNQLVAPGEGLFLTNLAGMKVWQVPFGSGFGEVFFNRTGASPQVRYAMFDEDAVNATVALTANLYCTFLQYDIEQVTEVGVNAPQPVIVR